MSDAARRCDACAAYYANGTTTECRLKAPQPVMVQGPLGQAAVMGVFPATEPTRWCLEFLERG